MLFPVRCKTCNKVIGHLWEKYEKYTDEKMDNKEKWEKLGVNRYCCKRVFLGYNPKIIDKILQYQINFKSIKERPRKNTKLVDHPIEEVNEEMVEL